MTHMNSKDIAKSIINIKIGEKILLENTEFKLAYGKKYGLLGPNGCGKTTLLNNIISKSFDIPQNLDIYCVEQQVEFNNKPIYRFVLDSNKKRTEMIKKRDFLEEQMNVVDMDNFESVMNEYNKVNDKLNSMDIDKDESMVRSILSGLGFSSTEQDYPADKFSGGWRMRVSLARALYIQPTVLLLDEPNNHLDLNAMIWLTEYLSENWKNTLLLVSHDRDFINNVCTDIINFENKSLCYYKGGYDKFKINYKKKCDLKEKNWKKIQNCVKKFKTKQEKNKYLEEHKGDKPEKIYKPVLNFLEPPIIEDVLMKIENLSFKYPNKDFLFENIEMEISMGQRFVLVGENGVGKTSFIKLLSGDVKPSIGNINFDNRLRVGYYSQDTTNILPLDKSPVEYIESVNEMFLESIKNNISLRDSSNLTTQEIRKLLGTIGLESKTQTKNIRYLSGGQKARVLLASLFVTKPHLLLLDEPTNHLDIETIDALIEAINNFQGAIIFITHNIELITKTNSSLIELCDKKFNVMDFEDYYQKTLEKFCLVE